MSDGQFFDDLSAGLAIKMGEATLRVPSLG